MKVLERAKQKNFVVDTDHYTVSELDRLHKEGKIQTLAEATDFKYGLNNTEYRVFVATDSDILIFGDNYMGVRKISVKYDKETGLYNNVATMTDGTEIFVKL